MDPDGSGAKELVKEPSVFDYDWSPDGRNIVFARRDASFASDLYIIPATGGPARNITHYGTMHEDVSWSRRGGKIAFISERRRNEPSMFVLSLQKPSSANGSSGSEIDWDEIHLPVTQPATMHIDEGAISSDGSRVAFRAASPNGEDLWVAAADGSSLVRLTHGNLHPQQIQWSRIVPDGIFFRDRTGQIRFMRAGAPNQPESRVAAAADPGRIAITAKLRIRRDEQFLEMFDQSCRILSESFMTPSSGARLASDSRQISSPREASDDARRFLLSGQLDVRRAQCLARGPARANPDGCRRANRRAWIALRSRFSRPGTAHPGGPRSAGRLCAALPSAPATS